MRIYIGTIFNLMIIFANNLILYRYYYYTCFYNTKLSKLLTRCYNIKQHIPAWVRPDIYYFFFYKL